MNIKRPAGKLWRLLSYVSALIILLLLGAWLARLPLAEFSLRTVMHNAGLMNVATNIHQLKSKQSTISLLEFSLPTETGYFHFKAIDTGIQYKPAQLLKGKIEQLDIKKLILHFQPDEIKMLPLNAAHNEIPAVPQHELQTKKLVAAWQHTLNNYLFFDTLEVQQLTLNGAPFTVFQNKSYQLKSRRNENALQAEISLLESASTQAVTNLPRVVINKLSADSLKLVLKSTEIKSTVAIATDITGTSPATLELSIRDNNISGSYQLKPKDLQVWLQPFIKLNDIHQVDTINGALFFDFTTDDKILSTVTASTEKLLFQDYYAENVSIQLNLSNAAFKPTQYTQISSGSYFTAGNITFDSVSLNNNHINMLGELTLSEDNWQYDGALNWKLINGRYQSKTVQLKDVSAKVSANTDKLTVNGHFSPAAVKGQFAFTVDHQLKNRIGKLTVKPLKALNFDDENSSLSLLLQPWPYPLDILSGNIKLYATAAWSPQKPFGLNTRVRLLDVGGNIKEHVFSGLNFDHEFELMPGLKSRHRSDIKLAQIDSGVNISNISSKITLKANDTDSLPTIVIQNLYAEIFGGNLTADKLNYDLNREINKFSIKAHNIDLAEIVKTQQFKDITASGRMDGNIPVEINKAGVFIENGAFINQVRSGTIQYRPTAGTDRLKQNPLTGIALDALKDFHYSYLSADVNFTPEGTLSINLRLKGTSPELKTNRPVHLNINTEQNLLSLLKSLRYAQGISDNIDKKVRRQYEKKQ